MNPATLLGNAWPGFFGGCPQAGSPVGNEQMRRTKPTSSKVLEEVAPPGFTLTHRLAQGDQMLAPQAISAHNGQKDATFIVRASAQVHTVRPRKDQVQIVEPAFIPRREIRQ